MRINKSVIPGKKFRSLLKLQDQMKRWSEWYHLSKIKGLGPRRALDQWLLEEDDARQYDPNRPFNLSTVTKAINKIREIITYIPIED